MSYFSFCCILQNKLVTRCQGKREWGGASLLLIWLKPVWFLILSFFFFFFFWCQKVFIFWCQPYFFLKCIWKLTGEIFGNHSHILSKQNYTNSIWKYPKKGVRSMVLYITVLLVWMLTLISIYYAPLSVMVTMDRCKMGRHIFDPFNHVATVRSYEW